MKVIVINMIIDFEGQEPIDQGVQAVCADMAAVERWFKKDWPKASFKHHHSSDAWEMFDDRGVTLDTFMVTKDMEIFE